MNQRAHPLPTTLTAPYWRACQRGELVIQRCQQCRRYVHFPEPSCPTCHHDDLPYEPVSGRGTVHTFSVIHRTFAPGFADRTPYVIAWIELAEQAGLRAFGNVLGCAADDVRIGLAVRVCFEELPGFGRVPNFSAAP